jgi:hypothetical protein
MWSIPGPATSARLEALRASKPVRDLLDVGEALRTS